MVNNCKYGFGSSDIGLDTTKHKRIFSLVIFPLFFLLFCVLLFSMPFRFPPPWASILGKYQDTWGGVDLVRANAKNRTPACILHCAFPATSTGRHVESVLCYVILDKYIPWYSCTHCCNSGDHSLYPNLKFQPWQKAKRPLCILVSIEVPPLYLTVILVHQYVNPNSQTKAR